MLRRKSNNKIKRHKITERCVLSPAQDPTELQAENLAKIDVICLTRERACSIEQNIKKYGKKKKMLFAMIRNGGEQRQMNRGGRRERLKKSNALSHTRLIVTRDANMCLAEDFFLILDIQHSYKNWSWLFRFLFLANAVAKVK